MPELSKKTPTAAGAGDAPRLESDLLERVLDRLGFSRAPKATLEGLTAVYGAWCQRVPFDNVRKIIHIASGAPTPLPGTTASDFFKAWLKFGVGGTCWSGAGACYALLASLGFNASRGIATMLAAPDLPPNHGTVLVSFGPEKYLVDSAMLHGVPLRLEDVGETIIDHPAWGLRVLHRGGQTYISWRPLHKLDGFECRLERFGAARQEYEALYNRTRPWSPFNFELSFRINRGEDVIGAGFGNIVRLRADGSIHREPMVRKKRDEFLVQELGISEELVAQLPADTPTPPPPGSSTARSHTPPEAAREL